MTARQQLALQQHPLSAAFPSMPEADLEALAADIKKHGQREPGLLLDGMVLDGWHRYLACEQIGLDFWSDNFTGDDPIAFVLSKNLHRRHLTAMQKAAAVVSATNWRKRGSATVADPSAEELAEKADVSQRTIGHAKTAQELGLGEEARDGKVSARQVEHVSKMPKAKRDKAVEAIKEGRSPAAPKERKPASDQIVEKLRGQVEDLQEKLTETAIDLEAVQIHLGNPEVRKLKAVLAELEAVKRRRDELMRENVEQKKLIAHWKKKADGK